MCPCRPCSLYPVFLKNLIEIIMFLVFQNLKKLLSQYFDFIYIEYSFVLILNLV